MIDIREIKENIKDINIPNESFDIYGKAVLSLKNQKWDYSLVLFPKDQCYKMCFPDYPYNYDELKEDHIFLGAYDGDKCIGLLIMSKYMFKYMYIEDLKVNCDYRNMGIGSMLIDASLKKAKELGNLGVYTICQDNNLNAFKFYIKNGFEIGGFDNRGYKGTKQEEKADIYIYLE